MPKISLTQNLRREYEALFNGCDIRPGRTREVEQEVAGLRAGLARYQSVTALTGVPWHVVAVIHNTEASRSFSRHLHNGDPLARRTVQVPAGRPKTGSPPFTWEESACDALRLRGLGARTDWSLAGTLYQLEGYNGWGYRLHHPHVLSPYLWSFSSHYRSGKYVADGTWSESATSKQCGTAVLLRRLAELGLAGFADQPAPRPDSRPLLVRFSRRRPADRVLAARAEELQRWLNTFPGIFVKVDGAPGPRTSDAWRQVTGAFLPGDPRAA